MSVNDAWRSLVECLPALREERRRRDAQPPPDWLRASLIYAHDPARAPARARARRALGRLAASLRKIVPPDLRVVFDDDDLIDLRDEIIAIAEAEP